MNSYISQELKKLVAIPSEYPSEQKIGEYVYMILKDSGYEVEKQYIDANRFNVIAEKGTGKTSVLLYSHLDTVEKAAGWETNPYELIVRGKKAYGLGAWDMKGGLLANMIAFCKSNPDRLKLKMAFCVDEEYISKGGHSLIKSPFMRDVSCVVSTEPAFKNGLQGIVIGRIGRAVYDVSITGKSHHFALYDPIFDMNLALADFIKAVHTLYKKSGDRKQFVFVRSIVSRTVGMSLPENMTLELDSSILPPHTIESVLRFLRRSARSVEKKYNLHFSITVKKHQRETPFLEPYQINNRSVFLTLLKKSVVTITKKQAIPYFRSSVADENIFGSMGIPTLGIGPVGANAHSANEWVDLDSLENLSSILIRFISLADKGVHD